MLTTCTLLLFILLSATTNAQSMDLKPCPKSPNCVSSQAEQRDKKHYISPIGYTGSREEAMDHMENVIVAMKKTKIEKREEAYIHASFTVSIFRLTDDVEMYFPDGEQLIHIRSASQKGYSDLGANRRRVLRITKAFENNP